MLQVRRANERGHADHGWLQTFHTFSFADYYDPKHMGFRSLRVINDDYVQMGRGFGTHPHRDMEILTYVLDGELAHKDSMGNGSVIHPGEVQRMSAGTGITHSEFNHSKDDPVHLLQIWILPEKQGLEPSYEQKFFADDEKNGKLRLVASQDARDGSVTIHQDVSVYSALLGAGQKTTYELAQGRHAWIQVAQGSISVNRTRLLAGDGVALSEESKIEIEGVDRGEILLFDLA